MVPSVLDKSVIVKDLQPTLIYDTAPGMETSRGPTSSKLFRPALYFSNDHMYLMLCEGCVKKLNVKKISLFVPRSCG